MPEQSLRSGGMIGEIIQLIRWLSEKSEQAAQQRRQADPAYQAAQAAWQQQVAQWEAQQRAAQAAQLSAMSARPPPIQTQPPPKRKRAAPPPLVASASPSIEVVRRPVAVSPVLGLAGGGTESLRSQFVLSEIVKPPLSLRGEG